MKENDCPTCKIIKRLLPPFSKMIEGENKGYKEIYTINIEEGEKYFRLGVYGNFIQAHYCPTCGRPLTKEHQYDK